MIVVDSSSVISLAVNCLSPLINRVQYGFAITPKVKKEIVDKPSSGKRFVLESMRIKRLISSGAIKVMKCKTDLSDRILSASNRVYSVKGKNLRIIHAAEAEAVALAQEIDADALLIDERTMRLLMEDPNELRVLLSHRNKADVKLDEAALKVLEGIMPEVPIIRSAELAAVAYEKGILTRMHGVNDKSVLTAALNALKYSGCAITWEEISEYDKAVI